MADHNGYPADRGDRRDRDRDRDRGDRRDRDHRRSSRDEGGRDRDERRRHRSSSRERRRRSRSRSRSRSPDRGPVRRRRPRAPTQWDVMPVDGVPPPNPVLQAAAAAPSMAGQPPLPAAPAPALPAFGGYGAAPIPGLAPAALAPFAQLAQTHSQQATRHARRIYVGGLPPTAQDVSVSSFFSHALAAIGGNTAGPGNSVVNVYLNKEKSFAFVEFRTVEETSNAMALDGIMFEGAALRIRRPNDYNVAAAVQLGATQPDPKLNLAAIGLSGTGREPSNQEHPDRIFIGGLPYYLSEEQCRELLQSFGPLKAFDLVKDKETGNSKGYGFAIYAESSVTDVACAGLNGLKMGDRTLTVRRASEGPGAGQTVASSGAGMGANAIPLGVPGAVSGHPVPAVNTLATATRFVVLLGAVTLEELEDESEYNDIVQDMQEECSKYGNVLRVIIPRPTPQDPHPRGAGKVVIEFDDVNGAAKALHVLHGRKFGGNVVNALYLTEESYAAGDYDAAHR